MIAKACVKMLMSHIFEENKKDKLFSFLL
uniref:Uncharacterized protein n=2 Tax=Anguilla anguilla TaxID=7936 RepID=A0A0E9QEX5_ANGAN